MHYLETISWVSNFREKKPEYEPSFVASMHRSIAQYLRDRGYVDIVTDDDFFLSREILKTKQKNLKAMGYGNQPNCAEALTPDEEEMAWASGVMGNDSPIHIQQGFWFIASKSLGFRACHEPTALG